VREPWKYPENDAVVNWTKTIRNPEAARRAFDLFSTRPFLNGGFTAGLAQPLHRYLREADRLLHSSALEGSPGDDQSALNLYCHTNPDAWSEVADGWNYCLFGRNPETYRLYPDGRAESRDGSPVHVVHGNGLTLPWLTAFEATARAS
jgi:hypothetical protein